MPSSLLVNTSRGPIVDERAQIEALTSGRLAGGAPLAPRLGGERRTLSQEGHLVGMPTARAGRRPRHIPGLGNPLK
ncbi:NAD(P)-dependent oxidoreductase [Sorangium sp. So ce362]